MYLRKYLQLYQQCTSPIVQVHYLCLLKLLCHISFLQLQLHAYLQYTMPTLQSTMLTCSLPCLPECTMVKGGLLWLPACYFGYLQSIMATCSLQWQPAVYSGHTYSLPLVLPSLLYTVTLLCLLYNSCLVCTTYLACLCYCLLCLPLAVYLVWSIHNYPVCYT